MKKTSLIRRGFLVELFFVRNVAIVGPKRAFLGIKKAT
jgi:hypothetical protein